MAIFQLLYRSEPTAVVTAETLEQIATVAQRQNEACGVTGFLLYRNQRFIQLLEGEHQAVTAIMTKIRSDRRHQNIQLLFAEDGRDRVCTGWHMRVVDPFQDTETAGKLESFVNQFLAPEFHIPAAEAQDFLSDIRMQLAWAPFIRTHQLASPP